MCINILNMQKQNKFGALLEAQRVYAKFKHVSTPNSPEAAGKSERCCAS